VPQLRRPVTGSGYHQGKAPLIGAIQSTSPRVVDAEPIPIPPMRQGAVDETHGWAVVPRLVCNSQFHFLHLIDAVNVRLIRTGSERMRRDHHQISPGSNPRISCVFTYDVNNPVFSIAQTEAILAAFCQKQGNFPVTMRSHVASLAFGNPPPFTAVKPLPGLAAPSLVCSKADRLPQSHQAENRRRSCGSNKSLEKVFPQARRDRFGARAISLHQLP